MRPVFQTEVSSDRGDCLRASVATILDLEISQVPHFKLFDRKWHTVLVGFLNSVGYQFHGSGRAKSHKMPEKYPHIDGYVLASVQSKSFPGCTHSVVMDLKGRIVHDPNPNKLWKGINVLESGELIHWSMIDRKQEV
jgi:hypothetical protein